MNIVQWLLVVSIDRKNGIVWCNDGDGHYWKTIETHIYKEQ